MNISRGKVRSSLTAPFALAAMFCVSTIGGMAQSYQNTYPNDITLPNGYQYPCKLTALPADLTGIPDAEKQYINHVYTQILKALQAKTIMLAALNGNSGFAPAYSKYYSATSEARSKLLAEKVPAGLEAFRDQVIGAIDNQAHFFDKASKMRAIGKSYDEVMLLPEAHTASQMLQSAWAEMAKRYQNWTPIVKTSIYHHLCALDLF